MPAASDSDTQLFVSGLLLSLSLCLDLGIVNVAIMRVAMLRGAGPAFLVGMGSTLGDLVYASLSLLGVTLLLQYRPVRYAVWIGGSAVLIGLTVHMLRETLHPRAVELRPDGAPVPARALADLASGLGLALSSPSAILWFASVGGSLIAAAGAGRPGAALPFLLGFSLASLVWSAALAAFTRAGTRRFGPRLVQGFSAASALLFLYFAVRVFLEGYRYARAA
jgi:L-lysine exporter family protein LysE/ArgO